MAFKFEFGTRVKDKITGFEGTVTGASRYITGCDNLLVQPELKEDGTWREGKWFDDSRLEAVKAKTVTIDVHAERSGGDVAAPVK